MAELCHVPAPPRACPGFVAEAINDARMTAAVQLDLHATDACGPVWQRACTALAAIADELRVPDRTEQFHSRIEERAAIDDVYRAVSAARGLASAVHVDALREALNEIDRTRRELL